MKKEYLSLTLLIERLHRQFLDVIKAELDRLKIEDVNNVQTLILYNIGDETLTVGELTNRGYYLGSNVSYNVKKLVENEFLVQERSPHDKRSIKVKLSQKGLNLIARIDDMFRKNVEELMKRGIAEAQIGTTLKSLTVLESFWASCIEPKPKF